MINAAAKTIQEIFKLPEAPSTEGGFLEVEIKDPLTWYKSITIYAEKLTDTLLDLRASADPVSAEARPPGLDRMIDPDTLEAVLKDWLIRLEEAE